MSRRIEYNSVKIEHIEVGNRKDLIRKAIELLGSEDSNGNNGAEYIPDYICEYFHLDPENFEAIDKLNEQMENKDIYCIDRYAFETAMKKKRTSDKGIIKYLLDFYIDHWGSEGIVGLDYTTNDKGQIDTLAVALAT